MFKYEYTKLFVLGMVLGAIIPIGVLIFDILHSPKETKKQIPILENDPRLPVLENDPRLPVLENDPRLPVLENDPILEKKGLKITKESNLRDFSDIPLNPDDIYFISERVKEGPNFAWYYTIVEWGCGTECQTGVVVDTRNNIIYDILPTSEYGRKYNLNSNLLIVNPPENLFNEIPDWPFNEYYYWLTTKYYVWENNRFQRIK